MYCNHFSFDSNLTKRQKKLLIFMTRLKFRICRQIGENIWQSKKLTIKQRVLLKNSKKKHTNRKQSDFSKKLQQMKKLAFFYGLPSLNKYKETKVCSNFLDKKKSLLLNLECRLDIVLIRSYFCHSLFAARQLILHQKICVNSTIVNVPSYIVKTGDFISIIANQLAEVQSSLKENFKRSNIPFVISSQNSHQPAYHLETSYKNFHIIFLYEPTQIHFPYKIDLDLLF
jgi:ribosomal protein S4